MSISLNKPTIGSTGWGTDVNNNWTTLENGIREKLSASRTYYVATTGSDSNDGLSVGSPFLTIQKAVDVASGLDNGGYNITIQVASGTYTDGVTLKSYVGSASITIQGDVSTPANVIISTTAASCFSLNAMVAYTITGFKLQTTTSGYCIVCSLGVIKIVSVNFGACANDHVASFGIAATVNLGDYEISGNATVHLNASFGLIGYFGAPTMNLRANITLTTYASAVYQGRVDHRNMTLTLNGFSVTGKRYDAQTNGIILSKTGSSTYFPGSTAGTTSTGGQYQ